MDTTPVFLTESATKIAEIASILHANNMPQEMINLILASRSGLPMKPVDPMSPAFAWVEKEIPAEQAMPAPVNESGEERFRRLRAKALSAVEGLSWVDASRILSSALNELLAVAGEQAVVTLRPLVIYREADNKI